MKSLRWIGLILGLVVVIVAAVIGGFLWGQSNAPAPTPTITPMPTPTHHAAGTYSWQEIAPGDCIADFTSAWQDTFAVVNCASDHNAQMLVKKELPSAPVAYPGAKVLSPQVAKLCALPANYNKAAAHEYTQLALLGAYPQSDAEWTKSPTYECFISAPKGTVLTTDLMPNATPGPTPKPTLASTPGSTPVPTPSK
jgi:flagellar basal body-associated protein FliL